MQLSQNVLVAILATLVAADGPGDFVSQLPSCSLACFQTGIAATNCKVTDYACQRDATNMETINNIATPCLVRACSSADAETASTVLGRMYMAKDTADDTTSDCATATETVTVTAAIATDSGAAASDPTAVVVVATDSSATATESNDSDSTAVASDSATVIVPVVATDSGVAVSTEAVLTAVTTDGSTLTSTMGSTTIYSSASATEDSDSGASTTSGTPALETGGAMGSMQKGAGAVAGLAVLAAMVL